MLPLKTRFVLDGRRIVLKSLQDSAERRHSNPLQRPQGELLSDCLTLTGELLICRVRIGVVVVFRNGKVRSGQLEKE